MADTMFTHKLDEAQVLRLREVITEKGFVFWTFRVRALFGPKREVCLANVFEWKIGSGGKRGTGVC